MYFLSHELISQVFLLNFAIISVSDVSISLGNGAALKLAAIDYADSNGTLLSSSNAYVRFVTPSAFAPGATAFVISTAAASNAVRFVSVPFVYARPRTSPPIVLDWVPRSIPVGSQISVILRLAGAPDLDPFAYPPGGGSQGWLPGMSITLTDSADLPRSVIPRLLSADGNGGCALAFASLVSGTVWDIVGVWNITLTLLLDAGGTGVVLVPVLVYDIPAPQVASCSKYFSYRRWLEHSFAKSLFSVYPMIIYILVMWQIAAVFPSSSSAAAAVRVSLTVLRLPPSPAIWDNGDGFGAGIVRIAAAMQTAGKIETALKVVAAQVCSY